jgi:hypothetical protein
MAPMAGGGCEKLGLANAWGWAHYLTRASCHSLQAKSLSIHL